MFDPLRLSIPMFMRFYSWNKHLYPDDLINQLMLTNKLLLDTYESVKEFVYSLENSQKIVSKIANVYDLYANADMSFIINQVVARLSKNPFSLNLVVIDLLDSIINKSPNYELIFQEVSSNDNENNSYYIIL